MRNLNDVSVQAHPRLNLIHGHNGAGKTSLLESMIILSRGRSFRTSQTGELSGPAGSLFRVVCEWLSDNGDTHRAGLERQGKHWKARKDGQDVKRLSELTRAIPLVLLEPESYLLVSGPPDVRRKHLDWGMFHVEHGFLDAYRAYARAVKQRNAALRRKQADVASSLDPLLAQHGTQVDEYRKNYVVQLKSALDDMLVRLSSRLSGISLEYLPGWNSGSLEETLAVSLQRDLERGVTVNGPHRADVSIKIDGVNARTRLSRGEQKALASAFVLAQAQIVSAAGKKPVFLLDDLSSELDEEHAQRVLQEALALGDQVWVTGTEPVASEMPHKVFHVKHGSVAEVV